MLQSVGYLQELLKHLLLKLFWFCEKTGAEISSQGKWFGLEKDIHYSSINIPLLMKIWEEVLCSSLLE